MKRVFGFSLRVFISFMAAKLILGHLGADTPGYLIGLTFLFLANAYLFNFLEYHYQGNWRWQKAEPRTSIQEDTKDSTPDAAP